jgi:hypothetical protein
MADHSPLLEGFGGTHDHRNVCVYGYYKSSVESKRVTYEGISPRLLSIHVYQASVK